MKDVLIVINNMKIGGAQKSLLSFLQIFVRSEYFQNYRIHLMVIDPDGNYMRQIPDGIVLVDAPRELRWMGSKLSVSLIRKCFSWRAFFGEIGWIVRSFLNCFPKAWNTEQKLWHHWRKWIPDLEESYDFAISYMDGPPNYWLMDKVQGKKKTLWMHSEYQKQAYSSAYDLSYYSHCDTIVTISEKCRACIAEAFPSLGEKIVVLENMTDSAAVLEKSNEAAAIEFDDCKVMKILSVGRLNKQKGFDLAIDAAKQLCERGETFLWLVVGEGSEREVLQQQIDRNGLTDCFRLVGARDNPYVYIKTCDILVQPSRNEGKSIVLDEAKLLCKPIVATNYTTVNDSLEHGKSGWIVEMTPDALCEGIAHLIHDAELRQTLSHYLEVQFAGNEQQLERYIEVMLK